MTPTAWNKIIHDLRAPVIAIEGFVKLLQDDQGRITPQEKEHYLSRIVANIDTLYGLLDALKKVP